MTTLSATQIAACHGVREHGPLIHCLTNNVVREITANVLLAVGASPAMVDHPEEAGAFASIASGVLINVGNPTSEQVQGMRAAVSAALQHGHPWVLDPVAVGALPLRTQLAHELLTQSPAAIRGNASEITALAGIGAGGRGVDSVDSVAAAHESAQMLVDRTDAIVAVSGEQDLIVSRNRTTWLTSGDPMMQLVIGTGCSLGAVVAAYLGVAAMTDSDAHDAVVAAHAHLGAAGILAARQADAPGSYAAAWLDALYTLTGEQIADLVEVSQ